MIREVQEVTRELNDAVLRRQTIQQQIAERVAEAEKILQKSAPQEAIYEMLRREFIQLKEQAETIKSLTVQSLEQKEAIVERNVGTRSSLHEKVQALFAEAGAETEEAFYRRIRYHQEAFRLKGQLEDFECSISSTWIRLNCLEGLTEELLATKWLIMSSQLSSISDRAKCTYSMRKPHLSIKRNDYLQMKIMVVNYNSSK